ncbi:MAG: methylated-DNA--[protein]-cysteine S-methyltransferase [Gemmatimonadetes bacterium]|nr:methylated-DNA--[protein]-cysteine S-methyltransferase [Gemmatimonadota bacterium]NNM03853.1 methylated-DNA--[protein]-cysteine S-methyltransferase [Gemmatimonadota bacterium]
MSPSSDYETVARALRYLDDNYLDQPSLDELAGALGLSKYHLQRLFTRWAGVSPKRFLQFLTLEHAKRLLQESEPVLATAFASGLSGPARLHDLFINTEGVTPGEYKSGGLSLRIGYGFHPTPFGDALLAATERGLCHLAFLGSDRDSDRDDALAGLKEEWPGASLAESAGTTGHFARAIFNPGEGSPPKAPLSLFLKGTNFQLKVWNALLRIPSGAVTTYGRLARAMGSSGSARAVGSAVGRNSIAYLIPCHRVIREMGDFGQYRWGPTRKGAMLAWESAQRAS